MSHCHFEEKPSRDRRCNLCKDFASILGAEVFESRGDLCVAVFNRDLNVEILGRRTRSPLVLAALFSFECIDSSGRALNLGQMVLLPEEVNEFVTILRRNGISITALNNHWLFEEPRLMYIYFQAVDEPLCFAKNVAEALKVLKKC